MAGCMSLLRCLSFPRARYMFAGALRGVKLILGSAASVLGNPRIFKAVAEARRTAGWT